ncbi:MAG: YceI family protein [Bacteroidetes bacterium]|nr:YceI family protein [Bacteroidota bacterium]MBS1940667.1 YceI family protein [Bacteroidota bacterium]
MTTLNRSLLIGTATAMIALASCGSPEAPATTEPTAPAAPAAAEVAYTVDTATSAVDWKGTMVGVKSHTGTLHFASGDLKEQGGALTGGSFTVDMRSYTFTDTNYAKPGSKQGTKQNLMGHLMSPEFFAVDSFPTAQFTITSVSGNTATGDMTIRGHKSTEKVENISITADGKTISATGDLTFNRQKYGVSWNSPMKDMVLSNDIVLKIELKGTAK